MTDDLVFRIEAPRRVGRSDRLILSMEVQNISRSSSYANVRFAVASSGEVRLRVLRNGQEMPVEVQLRLSPLRADDFVVLEPQERAVAGFDLRRAYGIGAPGEYLVVAEYLSDVVPDALRQYKVLSGRCEATATFVVD